MNTRTRGVVGVVMAAIAGAAWADLNHVGLVPPGGFVQAACYPTTCGCSGAMGGGLLTVYGPGQDFHEQAFGVAGGGSVSSAYAVGPTVLSISGSAGMGYVRATSSNSHLDLAFFANAYLDACWKETFTITHPLHNGQAGHMNFRVRARGNLFTTNLTGMAYVMVRPYKNNMDLPNSPYSSTGNADLVGTSNQQAQWGLASYGTNDSRVVDGWCVFSVPFTFGQPFTLSLCARTATGQRSSGGFGGDSASASTLNFGANGITWDGITDIRDAGGGVLTGATIGSASGLNWTNPISAPPLACSPADMGTQGGVPGHDGLFDNNDFVMFINAFFASDASADLGTQGGVPGSDGMFDNNDFVVFINLFFQGC